MTITIERFAHTDITIVPTDARNDRGDIDPGAAYHVLARVQPYTSNMFGVNGNTVQSQYAVYFAAEAPIPPRVTIIYDGRHLPALAVYNYHDGDEVYRYTKVVC